MNEFIHENGQGKTFNEEGEEIHVFSMEVDDESYPLQEITTFDTYLDMKPPERQVVRENKSDKNVVEQVVPTAMDFDKKNRKHRTYKAEEKNHFFFLVYESNMSIRAAAAQMKIPQSTAQGWIKKSEQAGDDEIEMRKTGSGRPVGRPGKLGEEHKVFLTGLIDDKPSVVLDEMMDGLVNQFAGLEVSKTALYNFVTEKCNISLKRAHFHSVDRNSQEKIEERFGWVTHWMNTDMDYNSNCVFVDEAAFHINMKRSVAWSKKGERAVVVVPKTRARTMTMIGAVSSMGVVNMKVKRPKVASPIKKRKTVGGTSQKSGSGGTVTGHYFNFIANTLDIMDQHEVFKGHYVVMDNAPIHKHKDIQLYIESRGYGCIYLPPYSPELNPIEQFWSVCKSKLKRERLLAEETLTLRIQDACNKVLISDLQGFCRYSTSKFEVCLNRQPL